MRTRIRLSTYWEGRGVLRCDTCREPMRGGYRLMEVHTGAIVWRLCEKCQTWANGLKGDDLIDAIEIATGEGKRGAG